MSRYEGKIAADGHAEVDAADILDALRRGSSKTSERRQDAVRRYLAASEGWREASSLLGGAFATQESGLKPAEDE